MTTLPLLDRVAIVTGASRGIGKAIAEHLANLGARVVINYSSSAAEAESLAAQINSTPPNPSLSAPRAVAVRCDVSDEAQVKSLFAAAEEAFGTQAHILVTSAGVLDATYSPIAETQAEEFDRIFAVNTRGTFACVREAAAGRLKKGGGGRIVTISSSLAAFFKPGYGAYTASKAAVEAMTKILAKELKGTGDYGELRGAGTGGDGYVLHREDGGGGEDDGGDESNGEAWGDNRYCEGGGVSGHRFI